LISSGFGGPDSGIEGRAEYTIPLDHVNDAYGVPIERSAEGMSSLFFIILAVDAHLFRYLQIEAAVRAAGDAAD